MKAKTLYQKENNTPLYWTFSLLISLFLSITSVGSAYAQATHPCYNNPNCTSNDFELTEVYLASDANGTPLTSAACNMGGPAVTYVAMVIQNNTSSDRDGIYITGTVTSGNQTFPVEYCFDVALPQNTLTILTVPAPNTFDWDCQSAVNFEDALVVWATASQPMCPGNMIECDATTRAKCSFYTSSQPVTTPLIANFEFTNECVTGNLFESVTFTSTTVGGVPPYSYSWSFGTGATPSNSSNEMETVSYNSTDTRTVTLTVTDDDGNMDMISKMVTIQSCCDLSVTCPSDQTYDCDNIPSTPGERFEDGGGSFSDACGTVTIEDNFSHTGACGGEVMVTYTITDDNGTPSDPSDDNIETCEQTITITSGSLPIISCPPSLPASLDCDEVGGFSIPDASYTNSETGNCLISGTVSGIIIDQPGDACGGNLIIEYSGNDDCGRPMVAVRCTVFVNPAPEASFTNEPQDETIECNEAPPTGQMIAYSNSATGSCEIDGQVMSTISGSHDECGGSYTESWTFT
ncbi:PKD domain-containing protein, partial [Membranihabitans maritimus]|uniref:PKD domain-containing protein n=1 Tax=Membranihabitans maritimus TaxID=2904244 RepID=UPI001F297C5C